MVDYKTNSVVFSSYFDFPISEEVMELTHIRKEELAKGQKNYNTLKSLFSKLRELCETPVLVAHNGNSFDH